MQNRLGLSLDEESDNILETEPFQLDGLDRYSLNQALVAGQLQNQPTELIREYFQADGVLPPETVGELIFKQQLEETHHFVTAIKPYLQEETLPSVTVDCEIGGFHLTGKIEDIRPSGLIHYQFARFTAKDRIGSWLKWLIFNLQVPEARKCHALLVGLNKKMDMQTLSAGPIQAVADYLIQLLTLYREGLRRPLPFFPQASETYIQGLLGKTPEKALQLAETS